MRGELGYFIAAEGEVLIPGWQHPQGGRTQLESVQDTAGIRAGQCLAPLGTQPATPALLNPAGTGTHHHQ